MPCEHRGNMIICSRTKRVKKCDFCDRPSTKQCDYPVSKTQTCDKFMCDAHAKRQGPNLDTCPDHPVMRYF